MVLIHTYNQTKIYMAAALVMVATLAWKDVIYDILQWSLNTLMPTKIDPFVFKIIFAIFATFIAANLIQQARNAYNYGNTIVPEHYNRLKNEKLSVQKSLDNMIPFYGF